MRVLALFAVLVAVAGLAAGARGSTSAAARLELDGVVLRPELALTPCEIALEKKGIHALKSYLAIRPESISTRVFLNYQGEPISERGISLPDSFLSCYEMVI